MDSIKQKLTSPVLMWALVLLGGWVFWKTIPAGLVFHSGVIGWVALALGAVNWLVLTLASVRVHRQVARSAYGIDHLVKEGIYASIRHPIYAGDIVMAWCLFVFYPAYWLAVAAVWATIVFVFWAGLEERALEAKFMEDYREYKKNVGKFFPRGR